MENFTEILFGVENHVATITLNRPEVYNALSDVMRDELRTAIKYIKNNEDQIRIVVLTGAGQAFCAGGDVKMMKRRIENGVDYEERLAFYRKDVEDMVYRFRSIRQPTIAAINGHAFGAGCSIALLCDMRVASEHAKFGMPFGKRGLVPDWGATYTLPRLLGTGKAMELAFTGKAFDAQEALRIGLINAIYPAEELMAGVRSLCNDMLTSSPFSTYAAKQLMINGLNSSLETAMKAEGEAQSACFCSDDHREGVDCFLEKRNPQFTGK